MFCDLNKGKTNMAASVLFFTPASELINNTPSCKVYCILLPFCTVAVDVKRCASVEAQSLTLTDLNGRRLN